jgi:ComEC/Rec2-related protein
VNVRAAHLLAGALCAGLAAANVARATAVPVVLLLGLAAMLRAPLLALACVVAVAGWWWGSERLQMLDRSALLPLVGTAARAVVELQEPPHPGRFEIRVRARAVRWGGRRLGEPVLLELPVGRAPPQGARLSVLGVLRAPRGPADGFDERAWLRRHGVHVVLRVDAWRRIGWRGGLGGVADRLHAWLARDGARGLAGERRSVIEGVVLGEDQGLSDSLKQRFRASGLYHLLAVSGSNVALVAAGVLGLAWLAGVSRLAAEVFAFAGICAYVLAVGPQPSVIRAGVVAALGSLAWLSGRQRDRWHALLLSAVVLLAWNPSNVLDPGFQLSFVAVLSIFVLAPRIRRVLEGYPVPRRLRGAVSVSAACGLGTAPVCWFQFHAVPLLTVPANAAAAPVMAPMLALALVAAVVAPVALPVTELLARLDGCCAAYLAGCARLFGGLPGAQIRSPVAAAALGSCALLAAAYACRRDERAQVRVPAHRQRPPEDPARAAPPAGAHRR